MSLERLSKRRQAVSTFWISIICHAPFLSTCSKRGARACSAPSPAAASRHMYIMDLRMCSLLSVQHRSPSIEYRWCKAMRRTCASKFHNPFEFTIWTRGSMSSDSARVPKSVARRGAKPFDIMYHLRTSTLLINIAYQYFLHHLFYLQFLRVWQINDWVYGVLVNKWD